MNSTVNPKVDYWVITSDEMAFGPYDSYAVAYEYGVTTLGHEGWTVTTT